MSARRGVLLLALVVALAACSSASDSSDRAETSIETAEPVEPIEASPGVGLGSTFDAVRVRVIDADGIECALCLWRANTEAERQRGLMQVTDLEGAEGMLFAFDAPTSGGFWMKDTLIPLDVAFFGDDGAFMASDSMEPCPAGTTNCPIYDGPSGYSWAIEVPAGRSAVYGLESGGRIVVTGPCDPAATGAATS